MAELSTIARPYAKAAFEFAQSANALADWSDALNRLAQVVSLDEVAALLIHPSVTRDQLAELVATAAGSINDSQANLVRLLAENNRLAALPSLAEQFDLRRSEAEKVVAAQIISAQPLSSERVDTLVATLKKRLECDVQVETKVDESLIGGVIIRAGDLVIDGSVKSQLDTLAASLAV